MLGAATGEEAGAFPATIEHEYGSTGIPEPPKRVVTVGFGEQDFPLALGVIPLAVREFFGGRPSENWSWARDELGDAKPAQPPVATMTLTLDRLPIEHIAHSVGKGRRSP